MVNFLRWPPCVKKFKRLFLTQKIEWNFLVGETSVQLQWSCASHIQSANTFQWYCRPTIIWTTHSTLQSTATPPLQHDWVYHLDWVLLISDNIDTVGRTFWNWPRNVLMGTLIVWLWSGQESIAMENRKSEPAIQWATLHPELNVGMAD